MKSTPNSSGTVIHCVPNSSRTTIHWAPNFSRTTITGAPIFSEITLSNTLTPSIHSFVHNFPESTDSILQSTIASSSSPQRTDVRCCLS